jgi:predicted  nucleic acid-binding Zn-ribbon protein
MDNPTDYEALAALAELDGRKLNLDALAASLPHETAERERQLVTHREECEALRRRAEEGQRERRRLEAAVEDKTQQLQKYRDQLDAVKTNKEYQSLLHEIELTKRAVSETEDKLLELLDSLERHQRDLVVRGRELEAAESDFARANDDDRRRLEEVEVELLEVEDKRRRSLEKLSPPARSEYERLNEHYPGEAFTVAADGVCQGCFVNIPAKVVAELRSGGCVYRCESCGRLLLRVVEEFE